MIEAGEVGAVFTIVDEASPVLRALMEQFNALQVTIDRTKLALKELVMPPGLTASVGRMTKAFNDAAGAVGRVKASLGEIDAASATAVRNIEGIGAAATGASEKVGSIGAAGATAAEQMGAAFNTSLDATQAKVAQVAAEIKAAGSGAIPVGVVTAPAAAAATGAAIPADVAAVAAGGRTRTIGPGGEELPHRTASAGRPHSGWGGGGGRSSYALHARSMELGPVGVGGGHGAEAIAGIGAAVSVFEALKANADLQQVQENLLNSGVTPKEIEKATRQAYAIGGKFGLTARDVLQTINEVRNPLNKGTTADAGVEAALHHAETLARAGVVLKAQGGAGGKDVANDLYSFVKSAEFRNAISDKSFDESIGAMTKADVATGGIVTPRSFLQMSQMLKGALPGLSDKYLYTIMPELAQEFKGSSAGTAAASLYQQLIAGQMRTTGLKLLDKLELIDQSKAHYNDAGQIVRVEPGAYKGSETFKSDPMKGMADLIDALKSHGITKEGDQRDWLTQIFGNRNAAQMAMTLAYQYPRLQRGAQGIENTNDLTQMSDELLKNNPYTQWQKMTSSLTNLGASAGGAIMPGAIDAAKNLIAFFNGLRGIQQGDGLGKWWKSGNLHDAIFGSGGTPDPFSIPKSFAKSDLDHPQASFEERLRAKRSLRGNYSKNELDVDGLPSAEMDREARRARSIVMPVFAPSDLTQPPVSASVLPPAYPHTATPTSAYAKPSMPGLGEWLKGEFGAAIRAIPGLFITPAKGETLPPGMVPAQPPPPGMMPAHPPSTGKSPGQTPPASPPAPPPPPPKVDVQITPAPVTLTADIKPGNVTLNMDSHSIASAIIPFIMKEVRSLINFGGHDASQSYQPAPPGATGLPIR